MKRLVFFLSVLSGVGAGVSHGAPPPAGSVIVRTYNYAAMPAGQLAAAQSETTRIFRHAGITLVWVGCRVPGGDEGSACTEALHGRVLMLRLVDRTPAQGERIVALGESLLDRQERGGVLMTIDMFSVSSVASGASTSVSTLLGRAIAHEMGHLLLGSAEHPRLGLMRALWSHEEMRGRKQAYWGFSPREAARMRQALRASAPRADAKRG